MIDARAHLAVALLLAHAALPAAVAAQSCEDGRVASAETRGRCCWPGQHWSRERGVCAGAPSCPAGRIAEAETCVPAPACDDGRIATPETSGRCCWPGQRWDRASGECAGAPSCPAPRVAEGAHCVLVATTPVLVAPSSPAPAAGVSPPSPGRDEGPHAADEDDAGAWAPPSGAYVRVSLGIGGGGYVYPGRTRQAAGFLLAISGTFAARLGGGVLFGGTLALDSLLGATGSGSGGSFSSALAPFLAGGPMLGYEGEIVRFEAAIAIGVGGTLDTGPPAYGAGGVGVLFLPLLAFRLADLGGPTLDLALRPVLGLLSDNNTGHFAVWAAGSVGLGIVL